MKIRLKLTLQFALITVIINLIAYVSIYFFSANYRRAEFYDRLYDKAVNTAKLLVDVNEIDSDLLRIIDQNTTSLQKEKVVVFNFENEEVYNSLDISGSDYDEKILDQIRLEGELRFNNGKHECFGMLYKGKYDRYVVIAEAYDLYGIRKLNNLRFVLALVFISSIMVILAGGWLFAGEALKPIKRVIDQVDKIDDSKLHARVSSENDTDEIASLAYTFNKMLSKIEEAFHIQKSFVSHASHELRTPLTAMTGQIEVSLMNERNVEEYRVILNSVLEEIRGLTQLTNGLLLLAQTNTEKLTAGFKKIRIDEVSFAAREQIAKKGYKNGIDIEFENEPDDFLDVQVKGDEQLLKSAFVNILDNACKFSNGKAIRISIELIPGKIIIKIKDQGIGIPQDEQVLILAPFYRANNAQKYRGYGLGLSLTKKIMDLHNGEILIHSSPEGTAVMMQFDTFQ